MSRLLLLALMLALSQSARAENCEALAKRVDETVMGFHPPLEARTAKSRAIESYSAPAANCRVKGARIPADRYVIVYTPFKTWLQIGFTDSKGEEQMVWVKAADVRTGPALGPKSS